MISLLSTKQTCLHASFQMLLGAGRTPSSKHLRLCNVFPSLVVVLTTLQLVNTLLSLSMGMLLTSLAMGWESCLQSSTPCAIFIGGPSARVAIVLLHIRALLQCGTPRLAPVKSWTGYLLKVGMALLRKIVIRWNIRGEPLQNLPLTLTHIGAHVVWE